MRIDWPSTSGKRFQIAKCGIVDEDPRTSQSWQNIMRLSRRRLVTFLIGKRQYSICRPFFVSVLLNQIFFYLLLAFCITSYIRPNDIFLRSPSVGPLYLLYHRRFTPGIFSSYGVCPFSCSTHLSDKGEHKLSSSPS